MRDLQILLRQPESKDMTLTEERTRQEALKKMGKYAAFAALRHYHYANT